MGMYSTDDTIAAVSSPSLLPGQAGRTILRISGDKAFETVNCKLTIDNLPITRKRGIYPFRIHLPEGVWADGFAYCFIGPASYTGQDLIELHLTAAVPAAEQVYRQILNAGIRQAGPGEFTQRAYLNGKFDLSQAEAVMHIVAAGSESQITAAQQLLGGGLAVKTSQISNGLLELLSLLEAGLDFAEEDIEFISPQQASDKIKMISSQIQNLLDGAVRCEELMDLPSVGLAGLPGAGKSSLMNALTASQRSLVSDSSATTRDVLAELLELPGGRCVLFDCAGLKDQSTDTLDQLANQAALGALRSAAVVIFCVDMTSHNLQDAAALFMQLGAKNCIAIGAKADKLDSRRMPQIQQKLKDLFGIDFLVTSAAAGDGLESLKTKLTETLLSVLSGRDEADPQIAINLRHRQRLQSALKHLTQAAEEIIIGNSEIAALLVRQSRQELAGLEHEHIDERILDVIFSKFCIGK
jgi:tRNA modification GTPase